MWNDCDSENLPAVAASLVWNLQKDTERKPIAWCQLSSDTLEYTEKHQFNNKLSRKP